MSVRSATQGKPENPFERGIFDASSSYPGYLGGMIIGAPGKSLGLPMRIDLSKPRASHYQIRKDVLEAPKSTQCISVSWKSHVEPPPDIIVFPQIGSEDRSLIVAEAKAAANTADPAVQRYFELSTMVERELNSFLHAARELTFEDGIESEFSQNFVRLINRYKKIALDGLQHLIQSHAVNAEVLSEALRWLPRINDASTYKQRLGLITECLFLPWARVRDGAVLALSSLADELSIEALRKAIEREDVEELRADMLQALTYVESVSSASSS